MNVNPASFAFLTEPEPVLVPKACYDELVAAVRALPYCPWCGVGQQVDHHHWCRIAEVINRHGIAK